MERMLGRPGRAYREHYDNFESLPGLDLLTEADQLDVWESYLTYMAPHGPRPYAINRATGPGANPFWRETGIRPQDFDWHGWREAMGYPEGARK